MSDEARKIREHVYEMAANGESFVSERKVAERFSLKRSVVREKFLFLEGEGFLERIPKVGYKLVHTHPVTPK